MAEPNAQELPEGFRYHADCLLHIKDILSDLQREALRLFLQAYAPALTELALELESDLTDSQISLLIEDIACNMLSPIEWERKMQAQYSLALLAYEQRGLDSCPVCDSLHEDDE